MDLSWVPLGIGLSLCAALMPLISEHFKVSTAGMLLWMRSFGLLFFTPVLFLFPLPVDPVFYLMVGLTTPLAVYNDIVFMNSAAKSGAGITTRVAPLSIVITFILWLMVAPQLFVEYLSKPVVFAGIAAAVGGALYFSLRLRKCQLSFDALKFMARVIFISALFPITGKIAMNHVPAECGAYYYAFFQCVIAVPLYFALHKVPYLTRKVLQTNEKPVILTKQLLKVGFLMSIVWSMAMIFKYFGYSMVPNPVYIDIFALTSPLWVLIIYRLFKRPDHTDVYSSLGVVGCAMLLVVMTNL